MLTLFRAIKFALQNFIRNFWLSVITITILCLALFSVDVLMVVNVFADSASKALEDKIDVTIFFKPEAETEKIEEARKYLLNMTQVKSVDYLTPEEALDNFKRTHSDDPDLIQSLAELEKNPLGAEIIVKANDPADYPFIMKSIDNPSWRDEISKKSFDDHRSAAEALNAIIERVRMISFSLIAIFGLIGILIVFNAVKVAIYTYREEIGIMKLVGASNAFVRAPFWIESVFYSFVAVLATSVLVYFIGILLQPSIDIYFSGVKVDLTGYFLNDGLKIAAIEFVALSLLCVISSSIAINRYLKV